MKSKFRTGIFLIVIPAMLVFTYLIVLLLGTLFNNPAKISGVIIAIILFLILTSLILIREALFKWNKIEITNSDLLTSSFFGFGIQRKTKLNDVDGYTRAHEISKTSEGHAIYIYINKRRAVEISDTYYQNFHQISSVLKGRIKNLGKEKSSFLKSILNTFGIPIRPPEK